MFDFSHLTITELENLTLQKEKVSQCDFEYVVLLSSLAEKYCFNNTNFATALELADKAKENASKLNDENGYALSLIPLSHCLIKINRLTEAQEYLDESLNIFRKLKNLKGEAYAQLCYATIYSEFGFFLKAFSQLEKALNTFISLNETRGISLAFQYLASLSYELEDIDSAIEYCQKALDYQSPNFSNCRILNNLGFFFHQKHDIEKAIEFLDKSLSEAGIVKDRFCISTALINLGNIYNSQNNTFKAETYYEQGQIFLNQVGLPNDSYLYLKILTGIFLNTEKYDEAIISLQKLKSIGEKTDNNYLIDDSLIKIGSTLNLLRRDVESVSVLNSVSENLQKNYNHELNFKCHKTLAKIYEEKQIHKEALKHYKIAWKEKENFLSLKLLEKLKINGFKNSFANTFPKCYMQQQTKVADVSNMCEELLDFTERRKNAEANILHLNEQLEIWQSLVPFCNKCRMFEIKAENFVRIKENIEENPYLFKQNQTCMFCFKSLADEEMIQKNFTHFATETYA